MLTVCCVSFNTRLFQQFLALAPDWCRCVDISAPHHAIAYLADGPVVRLHPGIGSAVPTAEPGAGLPDLALVDAGGRGRPQLYGKGFVDFIMQPLVEAEIARRLSVFADADRVRNTTRSEKERLIAETCKMLNDNPDFDEGIEALSRKVGTNRNKLNAAFKERFGVGPMSWLRNQRLDQAAERIVCTDRNIIEIALDAGYGDPNNFSTAFKRRFNYCPRDYRKKCSRQRFA